jgi:hypothetical protein
MAGEDHESAVDKGPSEDAGELGFGTGPENVDKTSLARDPEKVVDALRLEGVEKLLEANNVVVGVVEDCGELAETKSAEVAVGAGGNDRWAAEAVQCKYTEGSHGGGTSGSGTAGESERLRGFQRGRGAEIAT